MYLLLMVIGHLLKVQSFEKYLQISPYVNEWANVNHAAPPPPPPPPSTSIYVMVNWMATSLITHLKAKDMDVVILDILKDNQVIIPYVQNKG